MNQLKQHRCHHATLPLPQSSAHCSPAFHSHAMFIKPAVSARPPPSATRAESRPSPSNKPCHRQTSPVTGKQVLSPTNKASSTKHRQQSIANQGPRPLAGGRRGASRARDRRVSAQWSAVSARSRGFRFLACASQHIAAGEFALNERGQVVVQVGRNLPPACLRASTSFSKAECNTRLVRPLSPKLLRPRL